MYHGFKRVVFEESTAARHVVVAAPPVGGQIRVRGGFLSAAGTQKVTFESGNTTIGVIHLSANNNCVLPPMDGGVGEEWMICADNEALNITLSDAAVISGVIFYDIYTRG